jgi:hypothetical protein
LRASFVKTHLNGVRLVFRRQLPRGLFSAGARFVPLPIENASIPADVKVEGVVAYHCPVAGGNSIPALKTGTIEIIALWRI